MQSDTLRPQNSLNVDDFDLKVETLQLSNFGAASRTLHVAGLVRGSALGTRLGVTAAIDGILDGNTLPAICREKVGAEMEGSKYVVVTAGFVRRGNRTAGQFGLLPLTSHTGTW